MDLRKKERETARASWKRWGEGGGEIRRMRGLAETFKTEPDFYFGTCAKGCRIEASFFWRAHRADTKLGR